MRSPKNKKLIVGILLLVAAIGVGGKLAFDWLAMDMPQDVSPEAARQMVRESQANQTAASSLAVPGSPAQAQATNVEAGQDQTKPVKVVPPEASPVSTVSFTASAGNVERLTEVLADVELARAELALAELNKKRAEIELAASPAQPPQVVQMPALVTAPATVSAPRPSIFSIYGLDGELYAVLATPFGRQVVKKGDRLADGGRVENITASTVIIKARNGSSLDLAFED